MRRTLKWVLIAFVLLLVWIGVVAIASVVAKARVPVSLPTGLHVEALGGDHVVASGTWVIEGDKQADPLQTTEIWCRRENKSCTASTAQVMGGDTLHVHVDFYDVLEWERSRVVFTDSNPACVYYIYTIDVATKSVNGVRRKRPASNNLPPGCSALTNQELRLSLKDGFKEYQQLQRDAMPWFGELALAPLKLLQ